LCLVNEGDEVLVPSPYWVSYPEIVKLAGGKIVELPARIDTDFKVTPQQLENAITEKTKVFLFSSPCNPTGTVYSREELKALADVFASYPNIFIISDEIYEYINFKGKHESIARNEHLRDRVIVVNGVSKGYAMTGWRIGYIGAPALIAKACDILQGQYTSGASSIAQMASLKAVKEDPCKNEEMITMVDTFRERRDLVIKMMNEIPGLKNNVPDGAFYIFPNIREYFGKSIGERKIGNAIDFCMYLLEEAHVATVPGSAFGNPDCIRVSYATSNALLTKALGRIKKALEKLK
ncbi:MAG: pyridoxal phosphate-dependent aminotransferase, partial [Bacteroidales bacterium]|nr:pyridoxal phosphate-dependent aminotransferase [Bacteroidales bacterium]